MAAWKNDVPVGLGATIMGFITGRDWITGGEWQDFYGIVPLFTGSLLIAVDRAVIAIPLGIGAAIYTNQFAGQREQKIIKPTIEFIQAIPSVVLGFIGILVLGTMLQEISMMDALSLGSRLPDRGAAQHVHRRLPARADGDPDDFLARRRRAQQRAVRLSPKPPTRSAPRSCRRSSASSCPPRFPASSPPCLLGLGRVIGETMVVLLVAGNRIEIPDFTEGLGAFFQPAHTLTGIIAQELGEVPLGSVHYRALFVVGILLFAIVLAINCHRAAPRAQDAASSSTPHVHGNPEQLIRKGVPKGHFKEVAVRSRARRHDLRVVLVALLIFGQIIIDGAPVLFKPEVPFVDTELPHRENRDAPRLRRRPGHPPQLPASQYTSRSEKNGSEAIFNETTFSYSGGGIAGPIVGTALLTIG